MAPAALAVAACLDRLPLTARYTAAAAAAAAAELAPVAAASRQLRTVGCWVLNPLIQQVLSCCWMRRRSHLRQQVPQARRGAGTILELQCEHSAVQRAVQSAG
jgi:hypothetical protein